MQINKHILISIKLNFYLNLIDFHYIHEESSGEGLEGKRRTKRANPDSIDLFTDTAAILN